MGSKNQPHKMSDVVSDLLARRGFARAQAGAAYEQAWREAAGELAMSYTRVAGVRRRALEITVANSTLVQELNYRKQELLTQLTNKLPDEPITDLRFRVGPID